VNKAVAELNLEARAQLFKALSHPTRLLIISLVRIQPRHTEELASILKLSAGTVSHHLSLLSEVGLLGSQKEQYYQNYTLRTEWLDKTLDELINLLTTREVPELLSEPRRRRKSESSQVWHE
jgi:DNA-binding transcriptional ArsR family regulator